MTRFNVVTKKTYQGKDGEKAQWLNVGSLIRFPATGEKDESFILELNMFPSTKFYVFEQKKKAVKQERLDDEPPIDDIAF